MTISVTASINQSGQVTPTALTWQKNHYNIVTVGRQWDTENGRHILVETGGGDRFEILLARTDLRWYLKRAWRDDLTA